MAVAARADSLAGQLYVQKVNFYDTMDIIRHGVGLLVDIVCHGNQRLSSLYIPCVALAYTVAESRHRRTASGSVLLYFRLLCLDLVFPRLGEVWRCIHSGGVKAPFAKVLGSMVADRLSDSICVLLLTILTFIVATPAINAFLTKYPVGRGLCLLPLRLGSGLPWLAHAPLCGRYSVSDAILLR